LGRAVDEGVLGRAVDNGVLARAGVTTAGAFGGAEARVFVAVRVEVPVEVVDWPVCCCFKGVELVETEPPVA
jgi:hypothetical protein